MTHEQDKRLADLITRARELDPRTMGIRNRINTFIRIPAKDLHPHPKNWRTHPESQREALKAVLAEIGYAGALLVRALESGGYQIIDGHLRAETTPDEEVPCLVLDVNEAEAEKLLATLDPLAAMAGANTERLEELLETVRTDNAHVASMLEGVARNAGLARSGPPTDTEFPEFTEEVENEVETIECPECGHTWPK